MMKRLSWIGAALAATSVMSISGLASASSHREAPAISEDPSADNTDLYAWVDGTNLVILANYIPLEEPSGGPNFHKFSDDVLYVINIARGPSDLDPDLSYQINFKTAPYEHRDPADLNPTPAGGNEFFSQIAGGAQTYSVTKVEKGKPAKVIAVNVPVVPPNIGPRTSSIAYKIPVGKTYEAFATEPQFKKSMGVDGFVWAGPRDDGFYVDLGGVFDLAGLRAKGMAQDGVAGYNTHTIALSIPINTAAGTEVKVGSAADAQTIGVWATASRQKVTVLRTNNNAPDIYGPWVQVSRLGLPLINEAIIGLQDKDRFNRTAPKKDLDNFGAYFLNPMLVRDAKFAGFYDAGGPLKGINFDKMKTNRLDIVEVINLKASGHNITTIGDVLRLDLGLPSGFPNGRKVNAGTNTEDDVTDVELSLILTGLAAPVSDGVDYNDAVFSKEFPFLAPPWEGASQGHGKTTP